MDEEQRYLRFVFPGLAAAILTAVAVAFVDHRLICWIGKSSVSELLVAVLGSGGVGFLLAQAHFSCPWSRVDYRTWVNRNWDRLQRSYGELKSYENHGELHRQEAWDIVHYVWEQRVIRSSKSLDRSVSRLASRMSAIGATLLGAAIGVLIWAVVATFAFRAGHGSCLGLTAGGALFLATFYSLGRVYGRVGETIRRVVLLRLTSVLAEPGYGTDRKEVPGDGS